MLKHEKVGNRTHNLKHTNWQNISCYLPYKCRIGASSEKIFQEVERFRRKESTEEVFGEDDGSCILGVRVLCVFIDTIR